MSSHVLQIAALTILLSTVLPVSAQPQRDPSWPVKTVRLVVPYAPGGPTDTVSRLVAQKLSERTGQTVLVDNRPGAAGNIGTAAVASAPADGYTLLYVVPAIVLNPYFMKGSPDPATLTPITRVIQYSMVLLASNNFKPRTVDEIMTLVRTGSGSVSCGTGGGIPTVACEMLRSATRGNVLVVPYKGQAQVSNALMASEIDLMFDGIVASAQAVKAGRMRAVAALDRKGKESVLGALPAIDETLPGFEFTTWHGLMAPAGMPRDLVARINREIGAVLEMPDVKKRLAELGFETVGDSAEDFAHFLNSESVKYGRVLKEAGVKPE